MVHYFLPLLYTAGSVFVLSVAVYFAIRFLAYKRSFPLPHQFDFLWVIATLMLLFLSVSTQPPFEGMFTPKFLSWTAFLSFLLSAYLLIFVVDQFLVEYFLCTVLKMNVSPPLRKMINMFVFLIAVLVAVQKIFNINPWAIYAPTSLLSLGIGIALKDAFQTFFAGVALSRIIHIGDWIHVADKEGEVVELNWARVVLRNKDGNHLFIPNSELQKGTFASYNYENGHQRCRVEVGAAYSVPPQKVKKALLTCAQGVEGVIPYPAPDVLLSYYGDNAVQYTLNFWIQDYARHREIASEIATRVWYAFKRQDIEIPFPIRTVHLLRKGREETGLVEPEEILSHIDLFKMLSADEHKVLFNRMRRQTYIKGEVVVRQGDPGSSFYLVVKGRQEVIHQAEGGLPVLVGELKPGQFFGELSLLTGEPRTATVRAAADSELLRLEKSDFQEILSEHPALAENIAEVVALRQSTLAEVKGASSSDAEIPKQKSALSRKIRKFFNLDREATVLLLLALGLTRFF